MIFLSTHTCNLYLWFLTIFKWNNLPHFFMRWWIFGRTVHFLIFIHFQTHFCTLFQYLKSKHCKNYFRISRRRKILISYRVTSLSKKMRISHYSAMLTSWAMRSKCWMKPYKRFRMISVSQNHLEKVFMWYWVACCVLDSEFVLYLKWALGGVATSVIMKRNTQHIQ